VDDGSTDNTAQIIKSYESKITYIYQKNAGVAASRNTGIVNSKCDWVTFLDGDDEWLPDNLKLQAKVIKNNPDLVWSAGNCISCLCGENRKAPAVDPEKAKKILTGNDYFDDYFRSFTNDIRGNSITTIIKKQIFDQVGLFRQDLPVAQDIDMWFRIAMRYPKVGFVSEPIAIYHLNRPGTVTQKTTSNTRISAIGDLIQQNIELSKQLNCFDRFKPCAQYYLKRLIRSWLFQKDLAPAIKKMATKFDSILSWQDKTIIKALTFSPKTTSFILHSISKVVRTFNLRKNVVRRPKK
ncbi:MAG: glycosyltransferase, partial [Sedimentisphaerales bacterium]|nr:glycosyltransferase [Sedimentisphaerales bacterium]